MITERPRRPVRAVTLVRRAVTILTRRAYTAARGLLLVAWSLPSFWLPARGKEDRMPRVISRETPDSQEIEVVVYLPLRKDLWVYFRNGAVNVYLDVDATAWEQFETVESKEAFIHALPSCTVLVPKKKPD
jgi:hypothetical protein